jgi:hypothetical protein
MTSTTDRLDRLERALPPLEAVLVWLSEVHAYPSRTAYARAILDLPRERHPLTRILDRVEAYERGRHRGDCPEDVKGAVDQASRDAVFRYQLVLAIEDAAVSFADRFDAVMQLAIERLYGEPSERLDDPVAPTGQSDRDRQPGRSDHRWSRAARATAERFRQEVDARSALEDRYLGGRSAIFPDTADAWQRLQFHADMIETLVASGPAPGTDAPPLQRDGPAQGDMVRSVADEISDAALIATHTFFGEHDAAVAVLRRRLGA